MDYDNIKLTTEHLELAKKCAHIVWEKYDDTHGYRTEKQTQNAKASTENPENIWFFLGQFDSSNKMELFMRLFQEEPTPARDQLIRFIASVLKEESDHVKEMLEKLENREEQNG